MSTSATVFGLDVSADARLSFLSGSRASATGRELVLSVSSNPLAESATWPDSAELVCDQRGADGDVVFRIWAHPTAGFKVLAPAYGAHLVSADGTRLLCAPEGHPPEVWQRFLVAQVLPFAALLRGLEVFHASAVVRDRAAILLMGPSRSGKTSVAIQLCRSGAGFLADDVVAVERIEQRLLCHAGTPIAGVEHDEARRLAQTGQPTSPKDVVATNARELLVRMRAPCGSADLGTVFMIDRRDSGSGDPQFEPLTEAQPLLGGTFNTVVTSPDRLRCLLEICALASRLRVERVLVTPATDATGLAEAIERHIDGS